MEYARGGDLFTYMQGRGQLSETMARWFYQQLILALDYCHKMVRTIHTIHTCVNATPTALTQPKVWSINYAVRGSRHVQCAQVSTTHACAL